MFIQVLIPEVILATLGIILFENIKRGLNINDKINRKKEENSS
jgi:hypothetical protein